MELILTLSDLSVEVAVGKGPACTIPLLALAIHTCPLGTKMRDLSKACQISAVRNHWEERTAKKMQTRFIVTASRSREGSRDSPLPYEPFQSLLQGAGHRAHLHPSPALPSHLLWGRSQLCLSAWNCFGPGLLQCSFSVSKRAVHYKISEGWGVSDILPLDTCNNANQFACFAALNLMPQGVS